MKELKCQVCEEYHCNNKKVCNLLSKINQEMSEWLKSLPWWQKINIKIFGADQNKVVGVLNCLINSHEELKIKVSKLNSKIEKLILPSNNDRPTNT